MRWAATLLGVASLVVLVSIGISYRGAVHVARAAGSAPPATLLWSTLLALVPGPLAARVAAFASLSGWTLALAWIVLRAPRRRRPLTALFAGYFAGMWMLTMHVASGAPDAVAAALAGLALHVVARSASHRASAADPVVPVGLVAGALFATAAWLRPSIAGLVPGTMLGAVLATSARGGRLGAGIRGVLPAVVAFVFVSVALFVTSLALGGGSWMTSVLHAIASVPSEGAGAGARNAMLVATAPLVGFPLLVALAVGLRPPRDPGGTVATFALLSSVLWSLGCLARAPSAAPATYLLEPAIGAVIVMARADFPALPPGLALLSSFLAFAQVAWSCVVAVKRGIFGGLPL